MKVPQETSGFSSRTQAAGFVLAGGRSSRMGQDKALLQLDGEALLQRALRSLQSFCAEVAIAGGAPELARFGRVIADDRPGCGPLAGIVAALRQSTFELNCILAVDVPFVPLAAWQTMLRHAQHGVQHGTQVAVLPVVHSQVHPLCGVYSQRCWPALRQGLDAGRLKLIDALAAAGPVCQVQFTAAEWFQNLNTPEEFRRVGAVRRA